MPDSPHTSAASVAHLQAPVAAQVSRVKSEAQRYLELPASPMSTDPLEWWLANEINFPVLSVMARQYQGVPATSAPILMRGRHPSAARFPPHRSRPTGYPPNRQPATVGDQERGGTRGTTSRRTATRAAPERSPPQTAWHGDAVLHQH
jgi:hypothetical protein